MRTFAARFRRSGQPRRSRSVLRRGRLVMTGKTRFEMANEAYLRLVSLLHHLCWPEGKPQIQCEPITRQAEWCRGNEISLVPSGTCPFLLWQYRGDADYGRHYSFTGDKPWTNHGGPAFCSHSHPKKGVLFTLWSRFFRRNVVTTCSFGVAKLWRTFPSRPTSRAMTCCS